MGKLMNGKMEFISEHFCQQVIESYRYTIINMQIKNFQTTSKHSEARLFEVIYFSIQNVVHQPCGSEIRTPIVLLQVLLQRRPVSPWKASCRNVLHIGH